MPIYEYKNKKGEKFEFIQKFSDEPLEKHPETGEKIQRVFSSFSIKFNGTGFHNTDYK